MGTEVRVEVCAADAAPILAESRGLVAELEGLFSRFLPGSDIGHLNGSPGTWVPVDPRTDRVLRCALRLSQRTGGAFHPALATRATPALGADRALRRDASGRWRVAQGHRVDLGGIAKGYTADAVRDLCRDRGARSVLVSLGTSSIAVHGERPAGGPWRVALRAPGHGRDEAFGVVDLPHGSLSTSGYDERPEGPIDPHTGAPAPRGLLAATVIAEDGMLAEAYSTAFLVAGTELAARLWAETGSFQAVLTTEEAHLATPGLNLSPRA
jgi:thiamine biosynthesis lipoprotein